MSATSTTQTAQNRLRFFCYNTPCEILLLQGEDSPGLLQGARRVAEEARRLLDMYDEDSALSRLNREAAGGGFASAPPSLFAFIARMLEAAKCSGGAFDPTIAPVVRLWGFGKTPGIPGAAALKEALAQTGYRHVDLDEKRQAVRFHRPGMCLDPGAAGKGYAAGQIGEYLREQGVEQAVVNLGGSLLLMGEGPPAGGWRIGIQRPWHPRGTVAGTLTARGAVSTSGGYDRFFLEDGQVYHHLIDPRTGRPARTGVAGSTVVCASPLLADILSTIFFVGGEAVGREALHTLCPGGEAGYILLMEDGGIRVSENLRHSFAPEK